MSQTMRSMVGGENFRHPTEVDAATETREDKVEMALGVQLGNGGK